MTGPAPSGAVRLRPGAVEWREVEGEIVAVDVQTSEYLVINRTGAVLWRALEAGATADQLAGRLVDRFDVERGAARRDVDEFVATLASRGLLA
jgi:hypothetical protein